ncbi:hypothetical protein P305_03355 [Xylella fastidiosa subsp. fastidiosa Mus-1]|nr:hypothetical protein P305_03355 [Xylella fastidiosa subsp. fastidiosa Mus-1]
MLGSYRLRGPVWVQAFFRCDDWWHRCNAKHALTASSLVISSLMLR